MAEDLITHYIDRDGIKQDTAIMLAALNEVDAKFKEIQKNKIDLKATTNLKQAAEEGEKASATITGIAVAQKNLIQTTNELNRVERAASANLNEQVEARRRLQNSIDSYKASQKDDAALLKAGTIDRVEYNKRLTESAVKIEQLKVKQADLNKEIRNQLKADFATPNSVGAAQAQNTVLRKQVTSLDTTKDAERIKELNVLIDRNNDLIDANSDKLTKQKINIGNYPTVFKGAFSVVEKELENVNAAIAAGGRNTEDLVQKQKFLQGATTTLAGTFSTSTAAQAANVTVAKELGLVYGVESEVFKNFNKEVGNGSEQIKKVDGSIKQAAEGGSKFTGFLGKAFSGLRVLANILPGVGIAGILAFAIEPIMKFIASIKGAFDSVKVLNQVFEDAGKSSGAAIAKLEILRSKITDLKAPLSDRLIAVREYNKLADDGNKIDEKQIDNLGLVNKGITAQIALIKERAIAKAFESQLGKAAEELVSAQIKQGLMQAQGQKSLDNANRELLKARDGSRYIDIQNQRDAIALTLKNNNDEVTAAQDKFDKLLALANKFVNLTDIVDPENTKKKDKKPGELSALKDKYDNEYELFKTSIEREIELSDGQSKNEKLSFDERLAAYSRFLQQTQLLKERELAKEREDLTDKGAQDVQKLSEEKVGKSAAQKARIDQNILITEQNLNKQLLVLDAKKSVQRESYDDEYLKSLFQFVDKEFELTKAAGLRDLAEHRKIQEQKKQATKDIADAALNGYSGPK